MAKVTLTDIESGYQLKEAYNANNDLLAAALENTLSRDGTTPNQMEAQLDMNSNKITNLAQGVAAQDAVNVAQLEGTVFSNLDVGSTPVVHTYAALTAIPAPTNGDSVFVAGEGIAGLFVFDSAEVTAANGGTIFDADDATVGSWARRYDGPVYVTWFGADPTGVADSTAAFNLATRSDYRSTGNHDLTFPQEVYVPGGEFLISGPVYVHKGQHLKGAGVGATRLDLRGALNSGDHVFKLGVSEETAVEPISGETYNVQDAGGLAPEMSGFWTLGGPNGHSCIFISASTAYVHDMFMSAVTTGFEIQGTETILSNIIIDDGSNGIKLSGHSHTLSNIHFYLLTGSALRSVATIWTTQLSDCIFSNLRFYYNRLYGVNLEDGIKHRNLTFDNCMFYLNAQHATFGGFVRLVCDAAENIAFSDCSFVNMKGGAIIDGVGAINNEVIFNDCIFDGNKTVDAYTQSTTAYAAFIRGSQHSFNNCEFKNLLDEPIWVFPETGARTRVYVRGGVVENCAGSVLIDISAGAPRVGSALSVEGVDYLDQQKEPFLEIAGGWFMGGDGFQVLTGIGATLIAQYPFGRNSKYFVDTSTSFAWVNLPRTDSSSAYVRPKHGDTLTFVDYGQDWGTNNVSFIRGDNTINGAASNYVASTAGGSVTFTFNSVTGDWKRY